MNNLSTGEKIAVAAAVVIALGVFIFGFVSFQLYNQFGPEGLSAGSITQ